MSVGISMLAMAVSADKKGAEIVSVRKSTLWFIGLLPAFLMLSLSYGGSIISFVRNDQTRTEQLSNLTVTVNEIKTRQESQATDIGAIKLSIDRLEHKGK